MNAYTCPILHEPSELANALRKQNCTDGHRTQNNAHNRNETVYQKRTLLPIYLILWTICGYGVNMTETCVNRACFFYEEGLRCTRVWEPRILLESLVARMSSRLFDMHTARFTSDGPPYHLQD